jgi:hypothetical protein
VDTFKPSLPYLETHLTDHCNLNCKGCSHFSPIADEWFADATQHKNDMTQLSRLFSNIETIRLMGGEPLLRPNIEPFLFLTRASFPEANIRIVTNGILLGSMSESFWYACKTNNIRIEVTLYPPMVNRLEELTAISKVKKVEIWLHKKASFTKFINLAGDSDIKEGFQKCRRLMACPILKQGKIYYCFLLAGVGTFNKHFQTELPNCGFIDIYTPNLTGDEVIRLLEVPSQICAYCTGGWTLLPTQPWAQSERTIEEWAVDRQ